MLINMHDICSFVGEPIGRVISHEFFRETEFERMESPDPTHEISSYYSKSRGISISVDTGEIVEHLTLFNSEEFGRFSDQELVDFSLDQSREEVRQSFGIPIQSGGGEQYEFLGWMAAWDKFKHSDQCAMHIEYNKDESSITLVQFHKL